MSSAEVVGAIPGIENAQLLALVKLLGGVDGEARIDLSLTDDGVLHARIAVSDRDVPVRHVAVDTLARLLPGIGPGL